MDDFFRVDYAGKSQELRPMSIERGALSVSGLSTQLIALGGFNIDNLKTCEKYLMASNKWEGVASLNTGRQWPGSILLKSLRAFCFCGM